MGLRGRLEQVKGGGGHEHGENIGGAPGGHGSGRVYEDALVSRGLCTVI